MPLEKRLLKKLMNVMYYTPMGKKGEEVLRKLFMRTLGINLLSYRDVLERGAFVFSQHAGAAVVNACFLLALERSTKSISEVDKRYFTDILYPIRTLFMVSGGRPNINLRALFHEGNSNPAYGFYRPDEQRQNMTVGPPSTEHHVIMHGPKPDVFFPRLLISAKAFPPTHSPLVEEDHHDDGMNASDPEIQPATSADLIEHVNNFLLECHINVFYQHRDDMLLLEKYIRIDPLPFLIHCALTGSAI